MAVGKEIRVKIKSVENTRKITKAMEMVAASKTAAFFDRTGSRPGWPTLAGIRMLRRLTRLPRSPTVLVTDHLQLDRHALGSLFDGHLRCHTPTSGRVVRLAPASGPTFWMPDVEPIDFKLVLIDGGPLCDSKGRPVPTVIAVAAEAADQGSVSVQRRS